MTEDDCKTIITGQQIGLLGGPLYTVYKVLGAVFLAKEVNGKAVYWLETNDADFNEINHIDYMDAEGNLKTLTWDIETEGFSCGLIEIDEQLIEILETFFATIQQTEYTSRLKQLVMESYQLGRTLGDASVKLAEGIFRDLDLRLFTPHNKEFREFSRDILLKEAWSTKPGEQCNLFCMVGNQRKAIFRQPRGAGPYGKESGYSLRDGSIIDLDTVELVPNVRSRNICQDAFFNAHTYIAGPGEVKYISQLDDNYRFHGVKKAAVQPRMSITLMEPRVNRLLKKTNLSLDAVTAQKKETLVKEVIKERSQTGLDFNERLQQGLQHTEDYLSHLQSLGYEAQDIKSLRKLLRPEMKKINGKLRAKDKEKNQKLLKDVHYLSDNLLPFGKKQERVFNIFYYMNLYGGTDFIRHIYTKYDWQRKILSTTIGELS